MSKIWDKLRGMVPSFEVAKNETKLKILILLSSLLLIVGAGSVTTMQSTMSPEFCSSCHEMNPEIMTWKTTSHSNVSCSECHATAGNNQLIADKVTAVREIVLHVTNSYERPIKIRRPIQDITCNKCHDVKNREFTLSGDLIIPHDRHGKKGITCVTCHSGVVHGDIASREVTASGDFSSWTLAVGEQNTAGKYVRPKMNVCMDCHAERKVTNECEACHTTVFVPANHKAQDWEKVHGQLAKKDIPYCNACHSYTLEGKGGSKKTLSEYARGNVYCYNCHMLLPAGHNQDWKITHKLEAIPDKEGCLVCHDQKQPKASDKATKTYCDQCHQKAAIDLTVIKGAQQYTKNQDPSEPAKAGAHPDNWRKIHLEVVKEIGTSGGKCFDCHDKNNCFKCHTSGGKT